MVIKGITGTITDNSAGAVTIESDEAVNLENIAGVAGGGGGGGLTAGQAQTLNDIAAFVLV